MKNSEFNPYSFTYEEPEAEWKSALGELVYSARSTARFAYRSLKRISFAMRNKSEGRLITVDFVNKRRLP